MKRQLTDQEQQELDMLSRCQCRVDNGYTSAVKWASRTNSMKRGKNPYPDGTISMVTSDNLN